MSASPTAAAEPGDAANLKTVEEVAFDIANAFDVETHQMYPERAAWLERMARDIIAEAYPDLPRSRRANGRA